MVKKEIKCFDYDVVREGGDVNLVINTIGCTFYPSLEDNETTMEKTITEQIIETMIRKLKDSEHFTESILTELENADLTNKNSVV